MSTSAAMLAASPVTASMAVTSFETIFSAVRFSSTFIVLSCWSLFLHPASASAAPAMRRSARIEVTPVKPKKEAAGKYRQPLEKPTPPRTEAPRRLHRVVGRGVGRRLGRGVGRRRRVHVRGVHVRRSVHVRRVHVGRRIHVGRRE